MTLDPFAPTQATFAAGQTLSDAEVALAAHPKAPARVSTTRSWSVERDDLLACWADAQAAWEATLEAA